MVTLVTCQLAEAEGRTRAVRAARSLGERTVTELILQHQNPQQLSANLWAAVRARGCQFLGIPHSHVHTLVSLPLIGPPKRITVPPIRDGDISWRWNRNRLVRS